MTDQPIQSGFSGKEAEIKAENGVINELRKNDPNAAYQRAVSNLERARETGIDELIMYCTFTLGCTALEYRPYPRLKEAIDAYDLASEKALVIGNKKIYASTQLNLGISYNHLQIGKIENLKNAIAYYKKALCIYNKKDFPYEYAKTQNHLGEAYRNLPTVDKSKNLKNAIACYENALCIYTEKEFPYDYACSQINLGNAYSELPPNEDRTENIKKAITCYNNSLKIFKKDDHLNYETVQNYATVQNNLGNAYSFLPTGDRAENLKIAIACYNNALEIHTEKDFPYEYARTQNNMGTAYNSLPTGDRSENLKRAISCYNNALKIRTENKFPYQYGITQTNLGVAFFELQTGDRAENLKKTIACYNNVLKVHTEKSFPYEYATTQRYLGNAYFDLQTVDRIENLKNVIVYYNNALKIHTEKNFPYEYAKAQNDLGIVYNELSIENRSENLKKAISYFKNSLKIRNEKDFPRDYVDTLYNLTVAYDNDFLKDWQNAYQTCAKAIEVLETRIRAVSSAETRRALAENQAKIYHRMVSMCIRLGKPDEAVSFAERGKSRTLVEMIHAAQLQPSETVPKDIREAFIAVRDKLDELRNRQQMGEKETPRDFEIIKDDGERGIKFRSFPVDYTSRREEIWKLIDDAYNAYNLLLEQVRKVDPVFASLEKVQPISVSEINTMIPEKTVFIECFTGFDGTYVFVLDGKSNVRDNYIVLKGLTSDELFNNLATENWLRPYYTYLQDRTSENRKAWHNTIENTPKLLAEKFWYAKDEKSRSLSSLVEQSGAERVVFIPHSGLHLLPLHLIPLESGKRLFDKYEIAYAPSASMLRFKLNPSHYKKPYHYKKPSRYEALPRNENQDGSAVIPREAEPHSMRYEAEPRNEISIPRNEKRLFAVADPDCSLAFTDSEVQAIAKHFENPHILWHENASKEAVFSDAGTGNIVHFSCHGSFQYANPLDSKLILAGGDKDDKKNLTLKEIFANLKIPNADAVVLSACETGMVQLERGDEYVGIASGFMYAGANSVISSLWAVDDFSTSLLMQKFYDNILNKKMGKAEALKESQQYVRKIENKDILPLLAQLKEKSGTLTFKALHRRYEKLKGDERPFEHPYYWGAFVCTGIWY